LSNPLRPGLRRRSLNPQAEKPCIGRPDGAAGQIVEYERKVGGFVIAAPQVNFRALGASSSSRRQDIWSEKGR